MCNLLQAITHIIFQGANIVIFFESFAILNRFSIVFASFFLRIDEFFLLFLLHYLNRNSVNLPQLSHKFLTLALRRCCRKCAQQHSHRHP